MQDYYLINTEQWDYAPPAVNTDGAGPMLRAGTRSRWDTPPQAESVGPGRTR
jgi:hypothetical protein